MAPISLNDCRMVIERDPDAVVLEDIFEAAGEPDNIVFHSCTGCGGRTFHITYSHGLFCASCARSINTQ